ncbi:MAG: cell division topological specificity factor MinE [Thermodesulfobacteriota bacterium]|nr:cell division topological specificity factor MinE [Thermodesulfobacteriota bacterium]
MFNEFVKKFTGRSQPSGNTAKKRLQFALVYDKLEINDKTLVNLQNDIVEVISKYFEIDTENLQLEVQREDDVSALVFNTPIINIKREMV